MCPVYSQNKKARFDYEILETLEAGIVLTGREVKTIRGGQAKIADAFVTFHNDLALLTGAHIPHYANATIDPSYDPDRSRPLLLKKRQMDYLRGKTQERGLTIVPLSLYTSGRRIKLEIAVAKGKKTFDKRETIRRKDATREMQRVKKGKYD